MIISNQHLLPDLILVSAYGATIVLAGFTSAWLWPKARKESWELTLPVMGGVAVGVVALCFLVPLASALALEWLAPFAGYELSYNGADSIALTLFTVHAPWLSFLTIFVPGFIFNAAHKQTDRQNIPA